MKMRYYILSVYLLFSTALAAQKVYNVLDWKPEYMVNTFLVQKMHAQYDERRTRFAKAVSSRKETLLYINEVQRKFRALTGVFPSGSSLNPIITGTINGDGYHVEKLVYESFPGHHVTANLYIPNGKGPFPAALLFCGHEDLAKATASYQATAILFAKNGFVVLVIDPVSQSERYQLTDAQGKPLTRGGTTEHTLLNLGSNLLGTSTPAYQLLDNTRGLDYLLARKEVDTARIGCLGNSGGAIQAIYFAAFDKRVKVIAACSYLATRERTLETSGAADGCAQIPGEGKMEIEMSDLLIAAAPKPLLILAGRYDFIDYTGTEEAYKELKKVYASVGEPKKVSLFTVDDGHGISKPKREAAVTWFRKWMYGDTMHIKEPVFLFHSDKELFSTNTGQVNTAYADEVSIAQENINRYNNLSHGRESFLQSGRANILRQVTELLQVDNSDHQIQSQAVDSVSKSGIVLHKLIIRKKGQPPLPVLIVYPAGGSKKCILWLPGNGKNKIADSLSLIKTYLGQNYTVLIADLRGMGETEDKPELNDPKYYNQEYRNAMLALHIGLPMPGQRLTDILTIYDFINTDPKINGLPIEMHASGIASVPAIHALLYNSRVEKLVIYNDLPSFKKMLENPVGKNAYSNAIPGVLRYYDIPDLVKLFKEKITLP